ncbi:hypothetical protein [Nonomuraea sp. NPDC049646]|uniref:hypothetical protein n=1 Tax=unclassified Nonomuraea TaxID=2593643 RepID=UPI0037B43A4E
MILISAGLVLAAVVLLIAGFVLAKPFLIMWSIVVSVLSALFLVIGALLRRHELFPGGGRAAAPATPPAPLPPPGLPYNQTGPAGPQPHPRPQPHPQPHPQTLQRTAVPASAPRRPAASGISPDAIVLVIPGRRRYHVPGCRQLAGRDHEELTYEEAREEGFTPCTTCLPDAALGGRQLPPAADPEPVVAPGPGATPSAVAESRAETSAETRDLRPPVVPPKPDTKASTPTPEPAAPREEGATGWFGRPAAAVKASDPAKSPSAAVPDPAPDSGAGPDDDEQGEIETSYFRPPSERERPARPASPDDAKGPSAAPASPASKSPAKSSSAAGAGEGEDAAKSSKGAAAAKAGAGAAASGQSGDDAAVSGKSSESAPGKPSSAARPSPADQPVRPADRPARPAEQPEQPADDGDDASDPDTAPQPRVTSSGLPVQPEPSGRASGASERPSGAAPAPSARPAGAAAPAAKGESKDAKPGKTGEGSKGETGAASGPAARPRTVKVITGTRRYHSATCPLIRGAGETGVETMTVPEAEDAGLTSCPVCQHDRETAK